MSKKSSSARWAPGQVWTEVEPLESLGDRAMVTLVVANTGDRPIQVGSHFHFFEVNRALQFDREKAWGRRLAIAPGTAVRFEPGLELEVSLVDYAGDRVVHGFNGLVEGALDDPAVRKAATARATTRGFGGGKV